MIRSLSFVSDSKDQRRHRHRTISWRRHSRTDDVWLPCFHLIDPRALARYREAFAPPAPRMILGCRTMLRLAAPPSQAPPRLASRHSGNAPPADADRNIAAVDFVNNRIRHTNRLTSLLKTYFPRALDWAGDSGTRQSCDFLETWSDFNRPPTGNPAQLRDVLSAARLPQSPLDQQRIDQIKNARSLTDDPAIVEALSLAVRIESVQSITSFDQNIARHFASRPACVVQRFPWRWRRYAPRLLIAFGTHRSRWASAAHMQCQSGIAPVTEKSGKSCWVHRRLACSNFIRQTFHEFAAQSIRYSTWARACYDQMRRRGLQHPAAVRALAFKWIRLSSLLD